MTALELPRGLVRAAIGAVLPHAGRESEDTPQLGRLRFHVLADEVLVWATDHMSSAIARVPIDDHLDDGADGFDLPAGEAKKVLQVFVPPSSPAIRSMWMDEPLRVEVGEHAVTFTEAGALMDGQALTVPRVVPVGEDRYPDVPRLVHAQLELAAASSAHSDALLNATVLARFASAAKAYDADWPLLRLLTPDSSEVALVQVGTRFLGALDRRVDPEHKRDVARERSAVWAGVLEPLRRPVPVVVPQEVTDDVMTQVKKLHKAGVTLTVVRAGDPNSRA